MKLKPVYNDPGTCFEYFCELTEKLDRIAGSAIFRERHYIFGFWDNSYTTVLPIMRILDTIGYTTINTENVITDIVIRRDSGKSV